MTPLPVAGYYRVSQSRDGMKAPELYENEIRRYCEYRSLTLGRIFCDLDMSGYNNSEKRPALNELVRRRGEFSAVVVPKLSRFGRSLKHLTQLFDTFDRDGIALVFLDLGMDTSTSQGRLLRNIMAAFAEYESDVRGDYTRANARMMTERGQPFGGVAPYGYLRQHKSYVIDPERAQVIRWMFDRYDQGASQFRIAEELFERSIKTMGGHDWKPNKVGRTLDNPAYAALLLLDGDFVTGNWEPIVDRDVWDRVFERRRQTRAKWSRPRAEKRLLAGLIVCGDCGRPAYYTARGGGLPGRYRCPHSTVPQVCGAGGVNATRAEAFVTEAYLARARYLLQQGDGPSFIAERQWELATTQERRMLLLSAIEAVIVMPLPDGVQHPGSKGRTLTIIWKSKPTPVEPPPVNRHTYATGRAKALARRQLAEERAESDARSAARRRYFDEWRAVQASLVPDLTRDP